MRTAPLLALRTPLKAEHSRIKLVVKHGKGLDRVFFVGGFIDESNLLHVFHVKQMVAGGEVSLRIATTKLPGIGWHDIRLRRIFARWVAALIF